MDRLIDPRTSLFSAIPNVTPQRPSVATLVELALDAGRAAGPYAASSARTSYPPRRTGWQTGGDRAWSASRSAAPSEGKDVAHRRSRCNKRAISTAPHNRERALLVPRPVRSTGHGRMLANAMASVRGQQWRGPLPARSGRCCRPQFGGYSRPPRRMRAEGDRRSPRRIRVLGTDRRERVSAAAAGGEPGVVLLGPRFRAAPRRRRAAGCAFETPLGQVSLELPDDLPRSDAGHARGAFARGRAALPPTRPGRIRLVPLVVGRAEPARWRTRSRGCGADRAASWRGATLSHYCRTTRREGPTRRPAAGIEQLRPGRPPACRRPRP